MKPDAATLGRGAHFSTMDIVVMAVIAGAFGALALFASILDKGASQLFGFFGGYVVAGVMHAPGIVGANVVRKRGAAFATQNLFGLAQLLFGNPYGAPLLWFTAVESVGQEAVFFVSRYRWWSPPAFLIAGMASFWIAQVPTYFLYGFGQMPLWSWLYPMVCAGGPSAAILSMAFALLGRRTLIRAGAVHDAA